MLAPASPRRIRWLTEENVDQQPLGERLALLTDLYQLTMAACYFYQDMQGEATFSLFIRKYPAQRSYFVAAGLAEALHYLETLRFTATDLAYLASTGLFQTLFLDYLKDVRFTGAVQALPEGSIFFADEPILEVSAPIIEAQLAETFIINAVNLQTMIATKASRVIHAAAGRPLVDFSLRRTQGSDAGLKVARASYLAGFAGTSNVLAGKVYGLPIFGTMAHSYITSFHSEIEAFRAFVRNFPVGATLLIDTYDNISGAHHAVTVAKELEAKGQRLEFVRLDSGDMAAISKDVRRLLDDNGLSYVRILASGGFDEHKVAGLLADGAKIDAFAVGTKMGVSADAPYFDIAYKLVRYADQPVMKLSSGKVTLVDKKQVWRTFNAQGAMQGDVIALRDESVSEGSPLLEPVMAGGRITGKLPTLPVSRDYFQAQFAKLPETYKTLRDPASYPVSLSAGLKKLQSRVERDIRHRELKES